MLIFSSFTFFARTTAAALVKCGAQVIYACRNLEKAKKAVDEATSAAASSSTTNNIRQPICMKLDLSSLKSIKSFVSNFNKQNSKIPPLNMLVLNAGLVSPTGSNHKTEEGIEITFGVNHLGHYYLTELLLDHLRTNSPSRVIVVASDSHFKGLIVRDSIGLKDPNVIINKIANGHNEPMMRKYGSSKLANILYSKWLNENEKKNGVVSCSLHPGSMISTDIGTRNGILQAFVLKYIIGWFTKNPDQGASTTIHCCLMCHDDIDGQYFDNCKIKQSSQLTRGTNGKDAGIALNIASQRLIQSSL
jgi:NAD(P)-dependent dehydrogenase (short-subunit alcohol dehydrogenase family)